MENKTKYYKLVAADMDGTLLTSDNRITKATADAIKRVSEKGVHFCLTTGRPPMAVEPFHDMLGLKTPAIIYNGARIYDFAKRRVYYEQALEPRDALSIIELGYGVGATMCLWAKDKLYASKLNKYSEQYRNISGAPMEVPEDIRALAQENIIKIVMCSARDDIEEWNAAAEERLGGKVSIASSGPEYLEFFDRRVSKGAALGMLCGILGVDISEAIAIGDSYNDEQLLIAAGLGVAMGNAPATIKARCAEVTASNDAEGVRLVLEKYFL